MPGLAARLRPGMPSNECGITRGTGVLPGGIAEGSGQKQHLHLSAFSSLLTSLFAEQAHSHFPSQLSQDDCGYFGILCRMHGGRKIPTQTLKCAETAQRPHPPIWAHLRSALPGQGP